MAKRAKTKPAKKTAKKKIAKKPAAKTRAKAKAAKPKVAKKAAKKPSKPKPAAPAILRQFRFTAADTVQLRFKGDKKPERFRVDDMSEASLVAQDGTSKHYYQFKLVSLDR
ncbi:unnamed protein product, partial [Phaeothamnion confervicola]